MLKKYDVMACMIAAALLAACFSLPAPSAFATVGAVVPGAVTPGTIAAGQDVTEIVIGEETVETFVGASRLYSFTAEDDGYYGLDVNTLWIPTDPDNPDQTWFPPFSGAFLSKDSTVEFDHIPGEWYSGPAVRDADNELENRREYRAESFLHKGEYIIRIRSNYAGANSHVTVSVKADMVQPKYGVDAEPNDIAAEAVADSSGGVYQGYLGGYRDDGEKDLADWYLFNVPAAGTYPIAVESDAESEGEKDMHGFIRCELFDGVSNEPFQEIRTEFSAFENLIIAKGEVTFPAQGRYYMSVNFAPDNIYGNNRHFSAYRVTLDGTRAAGDAAPAGDDAADASEPPESATAEATAVGVRISWTPSGAAVGYRVFRDGAPLNTAPVYGGTYLDITAESGATYTYTVQLFGAGDTLADGEGAAATAEVTTGEISLPEGVTGYIVMKVGDDMMQLNAALVEIDPGRGTAPVVVNGRTMVPIRAIVEAMGGGAGWDEAEQRVDLYAKGHAIQMWLGRTDISVDGAAKTIDIAPTTMNDRTMLPVRFVVENVGCAIEWIGSTEEIVIVY